MVRLQRSFVPLALALFLAACTTTEPAPADTTSDAGDTSADTSPDPDGDSAGALEVLAAATIGPAGGAIFEFEFELIVRPGSLTADTPIEIRRAPPRPGLTFFGTPLELHPPGLVFDPPAVMRLVIPDDRRGAPVAVLLTLAQDTSAFQDVTHAVGGNIAMAHVPHFSTIGLVAGSPGSASTTVCCTPKNPTVGPTDCILNPANNTSCDPDICDQAPGPCAAVAPSNTPPCPCKPINAATPVADCLTCDPQKCVPDHQYCPPGDLCDVCVAPEYADKPEFEDLFDNYILNFGDSTCAELAVLNTSPPSLSSESWCFFGGAAKWCAFQSLLDEKGCTASATTLAPMCGGDGCCKPIVAGFDVPGPIGCSALPELECEVYAGQGSIIPQYCVWDGGAVCAPPTAPGVSCGDCAALASEAGFAFSYSATLATYGAQTCYDLQNTLALTAPIDTSNPSLVGTWCGHQAATYTACGQLAQFGCEPLVLPPPDLCELCTDPALTANTDWQAAYQGGVAAYITANLDCVALHDQGVPPPSGAPGTAVFHTTHGRWCAMNEALTAKACIASPTTSAPFCGIAPTPPSDCEGCTDPQITSQAEWQAAFNGGVMTYINGGMDCPTLAQQGVPAPSGAPGSTQYLTTHGRWCAMNLALHGAACTAGTNNGVSTIAPFCDAPECCRPIDPQNDHSFGCANMPDYGECVHSFGAGVCTWDVGPTCPGTASCAECAARYADPAFVVAVQASLATLAQATCNDLANDPPPAQFGSAADPLLAKYCAWGAAVADKCQSPSECELP